VLILDEATSSVDTGTGVLVQKAISALRSYRTSFVIAHRLSAIRDADLILVMEVEVEVEQIAEQGTHTSLLAAGGVRGGVRGSGGGGLTCGRLTGRMILKTARIRRVLISVRIKYVVTFLHV